MNRGSVRSVCFRMRRRGRPRRRSLPAQLFWPRSSHRTSSVGTARRGKNAANAAKAGANRQKTRSRRRPRSNRAAPPPRSPSHCGRTRQPPPTRPVDRAGDGWKAAFDRRPHIAREQHTQNARTKPRPRRSTLYAFPCPPFPRLPHPGDAGGGPARSFPGATSIEALTLACFERRVGFVNPKITVFVWRSGVESGAAVRHPTDPCPPTHFSDHTRLAAHNPPPGHQPRRLHAAPCYLGFFRCRSKKNQKHKHAGVGPGKWVDLLCSARWGVRRGGGDTGRVRTGDRIGASPKDRLVAASGAGGT